MYKFLKNLFCLLLVLLAFSACRKKEFDSYYGRPATLAPPIYQVLQSRGNFTNLLACIDKAGYTSQLSSSGFWTMFAPNDDAFKKYFTANGISSVSQISTKTATAIVTYCLVYNAERLSAHLSDWESPSGYQTNLAFKRRTAYHKNVDTTTITTAPFTQPALAGQVLNKLDQNLNSPFLTYSATAAPNQYQAYVYGDFNNKYIPYFTSAFMGANGYSASDYNYFYPGTTYTGQNVLDGTIVNADISAENGVIQEISTVPVPLPSLDEYLSANPASYSHFKSLFDSYMVNYITDPNATHLFNVTTGSTQPVYIREFSGYLAYGLNNESYLTLTGDNSGQTDGYSLIAPNNTAFDAYVNSVLLEHYSSLNSLPLTVIIDFLNSQMFPNCLFPSKFLSRNNVNGEKAQMNPYNDITDRKICSNGFFFGSNKVQIPNKFSTVFGRPYLDPAYTLMTLGFTNNLGGNAAFLQSFLANPNNQFTLFMVSDATFRSLGYDWNVANQAFQYTSGSTTTIGGTSNTNFGRIIAMLTANTPNHELDNLSGSGIFETGGLNGLGHEGDYVKYNNNTIAAVGNLDVNQWLTINPALTKTTTNGKVYYTSGGMPLYTNNNDGYYVSLYANLPTDPFYMFYQFLKNSTQYTALTFTNGLPTSGTGVIGQVQPNTPYTLFIPSNAAIQNAVNAGLLPGTGTGTNRVPNFAPASTDIVSQTLVNNFISYHLIPGTTIVPDGKKPYAAQPGTPWPVQTAYTPDGFTYTPVIITNGPGVGVMKIQDLGGAARPQQTANLIPAYSNVLANQMVIHSIDNYFDYRP